MLFKRKYTKNQLNFRQAKISSAEQIKFDENGKAIIEMEIRDTEKFYSPYSVDGYELMNAEVNDFIQNSNNYIPMKYDIDIHIFTQKPATEERTTKIKNTIARYYAEEIVDLNLALKNSRTYALLCFFIGVLLICASAYIPFLSTISVIGKLLDISSWVFIWEAIYSLTLEIGSKALYRQRCQRLINADVILYQRLPKTPNTIISSASTAKVDQTKIEPKQLVPSLNAVVTDTNKHIDENKIDNKLKDK